MLTRNIKGFQHVALCFLCTRDTCSCLDPETSCTSTESLLWLTQKVMLLSSFEVDSKNPSLLRDLQYQISQRDTQIKKKQKYSFQLKYLWT